MERFYRQTAASVRLQVSPSAQASYFMSRADENRLYIAPEKLSHHELLYRLDMSSRHYYRLRQQAITILSIRLWAAPDTGVDVWLEMLTLIEGME